MRVFVSGDPIMYKASTPFFLAIFLLFSPAVHALSLLQAYELALKKDLTYAGALAAYRALQEKVPQARAAMRPTLGLTTSLDVSASKPTGQTRMAEVSEIHSSNNEAVQTTSSSRETTRNVNGITQNSDSTSSTTTNTNDSSINEQTAQRLDSAAWQESTRSVRGVAVNSELNLTWPIFRPSLDRQLEQSLLIEEQALVQLQAAKQEVALRVAQAYMDVILSNENIVALDVQKKAIALQLDVAENNFKEGVTTIADVREAQAKRDMVQAQEVAQRNTLKIKTAALQALIGMRPEALQKLKVEDLLKSPPALGDMDYWVALAETHAYSVQIEDLGFQAAKKEVSKQTAAYKPSLDFVANLGVGRSRERTLAESWSGESEHSGTTEQAQSTNVSHTNTTTTNSGVATTGNSSTSNRAETQTNNVATTQINTAKPASRSRTLSKQFNAYVGVQLNIPLYDGGLTSSRVREALALQDKKEQDFQRVKAEASLAAQTAYLEAVGYFAEAAALKAAEASGQVALESNQLGYEVGVRINADILNAQQQVFTVRRDLIRSQVDALLSTLRLKASVGRLSDNDVIELNQWLQ